MTENIQKIIDEQRQKRNFNVEEYIKMKCKAINSFFKINGLDAAVIGLSGGVDSAVVLALLHKAMEDENSPLKKVRCLIMPIIGNGVTDQLEAASKAVTLAEKFGAEYKFLDLSEAYNAMVDLNEDELGEKEAWTNGQMASVLRTPMFYYQAAILQAQGYKSLVVGTTNRDEGSYIGFFGKASDAMVDLQPIADIHKSEVYQVAEELGVTKEIRFATPKGDVWDYRVDEEMIGAPYHFLEDYLLFLQHCGENTMNPHFIIENILEILSDETKKWIENIEHIHNTNKHKYEVGMPSHFIDVLPRKIPGGWN